MKARSADRAGGKIPDTPKVYDLTGIVQHEDKHIPRDKGVCDPVKKVIWRRHGIRAHLIAHKMIRIFMVDIRIKRYGCFKVKMKLKAAVAE